VSHGAVTNGVTLFFRQKSYYLFVIVLKSDDLFLLIVATPTLSAFQVIVSPVFFVNSAAKIFSLSSSGCYPWMVSLWAVRSPPSTDASVA